MSEAGSSQSSKTNERKETKKIPITKGKEVVKCNACFKIKRKDEMKKSLGKVPQGQRKYSFLENYCPRNIRS